MGRRFLSHMRFQLFHHGWPAGVGLALLACALGLHWFAVLPVRARADEMRDTQAAMRLRVVAQAGQPELLLARQNALFDGLPTPAGALDTIAALHAAAAVHGVLLAHGEYRMVGDVNSRLLRYQVVLPARSDYPALRAWLADILASHRYASLDDISLRRDASADAAIEARVRLTLYLKAD